MKKEMSCLSATKAFYGQMAECLDDYILVEEFTIQHQAVLLPTFVASLPGPFSELECRRLFRQIVLRVDMFHKEGLVHRNIQPSSFVVETDVSSPDIKHTFQFDFHFSIQFLAC